MRIIVWVIVFLTGVLIGVYATYMYYKNNPKVVVKEVVVHDTVYIKKPTSCKEYKECYESKIRMQVTTRDDIVHVTAYDNCKSADAEIKVEAKRDIKELVGIGIGSFIVGVLVVLLL